MQGNFDSAAEKYLAVSRILEKTQTELYAKKSFLGKWVSSKNAIEMINGNLFAHGGIHPKIANSDISLDEINKTIRSNYYSAYYPKQRKPSHKF